MSSQNVNLNLFLSGAWTFVPTYSESGATIKRGLDAGESWPSPSSFTCEINNDSLDYDPSRPQSLLYGIAGRNTRARLAVGGTSRLWAEAAEYVPERTIEHVSGASKGRSWTKLTAEGVLSRIGSWTEALRSAMYQTNSTRTTSIGHWSLEDDKLAAGLSNSSKVLPNGPGSFKGGATLGDAECALGAAQSVKVTALSQLSGRFGNASTTAGWQVYLAFRLPAVPASATYITFFKWTTSNGYTWTIQVSSAGYKFETFDSVGTSLWSQTLTFAGTFAGGAPTNWTWMRVQGTVSAGTVTVEPAWYLQNQYQSVGGTYTFSGSVGALRQWFQEGSAYTDGAWFSHIGGLTTTAENLTGTTAQQIFNGYRGERAGVRYDRLCTARGIQHFFLGDSLQTAPMGPQRPDTLISLLKEIVETEAGRIDDERFDIGLTMTTLRYMYGVAPTLTLTYPGQIKPMLRKIIGSAGSRNRITAKNRDGGELTVSLDSGSMSTLVPPTGIGEISAQLDVNVADEGNQLLSCATFALAKGTLERPRYNEVSVDLLANPGLAASVNAVREGDMIQINGYEPDPIQLLVVGIVDQMTLVERTVTFKTEPYEPYQVDLYDAVTARYDSKTSTLAAAAASGATSFSLTTVDVNDVWSTTAGYQLMVGGERVTVTAMTVAAGTGPYTQTATVTRAVNGVVKAQLINTVVSLADPKRWGI